LTPETANGVRVAVHAADAAQAAAVAVAYALAIIALSLITRDILPNKGLFVLGLTAFILAVLPFTLTPRKAP